MLLGILLAGRTWYHRKLQRQGDNSIIELILRYGFNGSGRFMAQFSRHEILLGYMQ
ncbi:MAG: hypothetical protein GY905_08085 [Gammaproteobacteria bacterium]|nr:hypothetical protein [Gammaproteobacteria bacterium]